MRRRLARDPEARKLAETLSLVSLALEDPAPRTLSSPEASPAPKKRATLRTLAGVAAATAAVLLPTALWRQKGPEPINQLPDVALEVPIPRQDTGLPTPLYLSTHFLLVSTTGTIASIDTLCLELDSRSESAEPLEDKALLDSPVLPPWSSPWIRQTTTELETHNLSFLGSQVR